MPLYFVLLAVGLVLGGLSLLYGTREAMGIAFLAVVVWFLFLKKYLW